jgi:hypothetical protein
MLASSTFKNPFSNGRKEITDCTVTVSNATPKAFDVLLKWLYSGHFYILVQDNLAAPGDKAKSSPDAKWTEWGKYYKLSQLFQPSDFS